MKKNTPIPVHQPLRKTVKLWLVTLLADGSSLFLLDGVSLLTGSLLVLINTLFPLPISLTGAVIFLILTYIVWMKGLLMNAERNYELLEKDGVSTKSLAKIMYHLAPRITRADWYERVFNKTRISPERFKKSITFLGFGIGELTKEIPYYAGAFVIGAFNESSHSQILFLGGANLGAAIFEWSQSILTKKYLIHRLALHRHKARIQKKVARKILKHRSSPAASSIRRPL